MLARKLGTRGRLDVEGERVYHGDALSIKDPTALTNKLSEQVQQKHLNKLILVEVVLDHIDGNTPKENLLYFLNSGKRLKVSEENVLKKFWQKLEYVLYILKVTNSTIARWAKFLKKKIIFKHKGLSNQHFLMYLSTFYKMEKLLTCLECEHISLNH